VQDNQNDLPDVGIPGAYIPGYILFHPVLSSTEKLLFGIIDNLAQGEKGCFMSNRNLGEMLHRQPQVISIAVSSLKNLGFLKVVHQNKGGMTNETERNIFIEHNIPKIYRKFNLLWHLYHIKKQHNKLEELRQIEEEIIKMIKNDKADPIKENLKGGYDSHEGGLRKVVHNKSNTDKNNNDRRNNSFSYEKDSAVKETTAPSSLVSNISTLQETNNLPAEIKQAPSLSKQEEPLAVETIGSNFRRIRQTFTEKDNPLAKENKNGTTSREIAVQIMNHWDNLKLCNKPKYHPSTIQALEDMMKGRTLKGERDYPNYQEKKFGKDEIIMAINNFHKAAFDENYKPSNLNTKKKYRNIPLHIWLFNSFAKKPFSMFISYFEKQPKLIPATNVKLIPDKFPELTSEIKTVYVNLISGGSVTRGPWGIYQENDFITASLNMMRFIEDNKDKIATSFKSDLNDPASLAKWLVRSVVSSLHDDRASSDIKPSWLSNEITIKESLPKYLKDQAIFNNGYHADVNSGLLGGVRCESRR
jgi:hypothetical protein